MAYLNKIDINGRTYYLQHLTDGTNEAKLPTPVRDDELLLRSQVVNSVTSKDSQNGWRVPLSAAQGYSLNTKLNQEIVNREADVDEEQARAEASELVLTNNLNKEIQDRISDVDAEEVRALAAEKVLTDNLVQEIQDRTNDVNAEETRALAAEKVLTDNLAQEVTDRTNAVTAEQNRATAKENEISANLTAEVNRAKAAEQANANAIATEKSRAEGIESNHESRITTMETFFKSADIDASQEFIDTLKEIQGYIADDKTGAAAMSASIGANKTAIETEAGRAKGIEADLQSQITTEATTARAAEKANADAIAVLNGSAEGSVTKAVADARTALTTEINKKLDAADAYVHPGYTARTSGLYKITVDATGHVSGVDTVVKKDITDLGVPAQDTTYGVATDSNDGLLSAADKAKYDEYDVRIGSIVGNFEAPMDYIIDQGTSGNWTYRKWGSGVSECWGTLSGTMAPSEAESGLTGLSVFSGSVVFPDGLFVDIPSVTYNCRIGNGYSFPADAETSTITHFNWTALSTVTTGSVECKITAKAFGVWK